MRSLRFSVGRKMWDRARTTPGLGGHIIALVLMIVLAVGAALTMVAQSNSQMPWAQQQEVKFEFEEVPGVTTASSQSVTIAGVKVGQIVDTETTDRGTAVLTLSIEGEHTIYDNAKAVLRAVNPLNQMYVEVNPGGPPGKQLADDAVVPASRTKRPVQVDEVTGHFREDTQQAISDMLRQADVALARAPEELPEGLAATDRTLESLRPAMEALDARQKNIRKLVTHVGDIADAIGGNHERALRLAEATDKTLSVLAANSKQLRGTLEQLPGLNEELRRSLSGTQKLTGQLDPTLDSLRKVSDELPSTLDKLTDMSGTLGDTVDSARPVVADATPLLRNLRPFANNANVALSDVLPVTAKLNSHTKDVVNNLTELQAFVFNTASVFGVQDARSGIIRGHAVAPLPDGNVVPGAGGGYVPTPAESGLPADGKGGD